MRIELDYLIRVSIIGFNFRMLKEDPISIDVNVLIPIFYFKNFQESIPN